MSNKQKNIGLIIGFLVMLIIAYKFSFQRTFESKKIVKELRKESKLLANASNRIFSLQQENKYLDSILNINNVSIENSFQQTLLQKLNTFKSEEKIDIISFNEPHSFISKDANLLTYSFTVRAKFTSLVKLTNYIEIQNLGELVSVNFEKKKNYKNNRSYLVCEFLLQKLSK